MPRRVVSRQYFKSFAAWQIFPAKYFKNFAASFPANIFKVLPRGKSFSPHTVQLYG
jgi:hypothetical protein